MSFSNALILSWITYEHDNVGELKTLDFCISYNSIYCILRTNLDGTDSDASGGYCYHAIRTYTLNSLTCMFTATNRINGGWFMVIGT